MLTSVLGYILFAWLDHIIFVMGCYVSIPLFFKWLNHYSDVIMTTMASQITSLTVVCATVYSDADQRKHQSSASLAFVWGIHRDRGTKGQLRGKCFHLMTSSCLNHSPSLCDCHSLSLPITVKRFSRNNLWVFSYKSSLYHHTRVKLIFLKFGRPFVPCF